MWNLCSRVLTHLASWTGFEPVRVRTRHNIGSTGSSFVILIPVIVLIASAIRIILTEFKV